MAAIVLLEPKNAGGQWIDGLTGARGYSHALVDPAWGDAARTVIDVTIARGVCFSTWAESVGDRGHRRLELGLLVGAHLVDELVGHVGRGFDLLGAFGVLTGDARLCKGVYCSGVIAACLPPSLRARLPPCVSPADLLELGGAPCS